MAIYLDANLLHSWKTFSELDRIALTIVAQQIKQRVLVSEVAAWEGEAHYRRTLERAATDLNRVHKAAKEAFRGQDLPPPTPLDVDARVSRWREELAQFAEVLPIHEDDASESHRREAFGLPPARRIVNDRGVDVGGKGGRDAAIWLAVVRDHAGRDEEGHFISENTSDFGKTAELPPALIRDLDHPAQPLNNYGSMDDFLALLGNPVRDARMSLEEVAHRLPRVLRVVLPVSSYVPRAIFSADYDWEAFHYHTEINEARPTRIVASRRYQQEDQAITVVNVHCEIVVDCFRFPRASEVGPTVGFTDVPVSGTIQAYLPDNQEQLAQVVSARLEAANLPAPTHGIGG